MTSRLAEEIKQTKPFSSVAEEAFLSVARTAEALGGAIAEVFKPYGITGTQYNVLRILRGAGEQGLPCSEIGGRMVTRDPDVTRLLDRLERMQYVARERSSADRRVVTSRITPSGLELLARLDEPLTQAHERLLGHMSREQLVSLVDLLQLARDHTG
jgi:MarR family transcriptional regulator, organic hydroperoxide resistance regulator